MGCFAYRFLYNICHRFVTTSTMLIPENSLRCHELCTHCTEWMRCTLLRQWSSLCWNMDDCGPVWRPDCFDNFIRLRLTSFEADSLIWPMKTITALVRCLAEYRKTSGCNITGRTARSAKDMPGIYRSIIMDCNITSDAVCQQLRSMLKNLAQVSISLSTYLVLSSCIFGAHPTS